MKKTLDVMLLASAFVAGGNACAQPAYPEKPVRMIVHFAAGGPTDIVARLVGQRLSEAWAKPVVVENIPGAAGNIGADRAAKSAPDGYTILFCASSLAVNVSLHHDLKYDLVRDFAPISLVATAPFVLVVHKSLPASTVAELVAFAKAHPGALTYASSGTGSASHLSGELFNMMAGVETTHVPYKGTTAAIPDLVEDRVSMTFATAAAILPTVHEGKLRALAVASSKRWSGDPRLPTVAEAGVPGFEAGTWFGLLAPAKTPPALVAKIHDDVVKILALPALQRRLSELGMEVVGDSPDEFSGFIKTDIAKWAKVINKTGVRAE